VVVQTLLKMVRVAFLFDAQHWTRREHGETVIG